MSTAYKKGRAVRSDGISKMFSFVGGGNLSILRIVFKCHTITKPQREIITLHGAMVNNLDKFDSSK